MCALHIAEMTKRFDSLVALDNIDLKFREGELCGLAGHNGAGKSTLINVLCGAFQPDAGYMELHGRPYRPRSYRDAMQAGIFRVSQELTLFDNMTVAENASLGVEHIYTRTGFLDRKRIRRDLADFLVRIKLTSLPLDARAGELPLALKQLTEIVRCLFCAHKRGVEQPVLLFDEPTSGLSQAQSEFVGEHLRRLAEHAILILTSHRGTELLDLPQRVVVMRDGRLVADCPSQGLDLDRLEELMVGNKRAELADAVRRGTSESGDIALDLSGAACLADGALSVRFGEVVGIVAEGEQTSDLLAAVAGCRHMDDLDIRVQGKNVPASVQARAHAGLRYVPAERAREGFSVWQPVSWNVTLPGLVRGGEYRSFARKPRREARFVEDLVERFQIRVPDVHGPIAALSGGNQQRLMLARMFDPDARVLLCDRPTRGVDVTATAAIHRVIREAAASGLACLVTSDEPDELARLCDRTVVLREGQPNRDVAMTGTFSGDAAQIMDEAAGRIPHPQTAGVSKPEVTP